MGANDAIYTHVTNESKVTHYKLLQQLERKDDAWTRVPLKREVKSS